MHSIDLKDFTECINIKIATPIDIIALITFIFVNLIYKNISWNRNLAKIKKLCYTTVVFLTTDSRLLYIRGGYNGELGCIYIFRFNL